MNIREDKGRPDGGNAPMEREFRPRERRGASYAGRGNTNFRRERGDRRDSRERGNERGERVFYDKFSRRPRRREW